MNIVLFGPPGAGKGTQSALLIDELRMKHISSGDMFRSHIKNQTALGKEAKSYIDAGNLVPDDLTIRMVSSELESSKQDFVLDGFPRNVAQAEALDKLLESLGRPVEKALFLEVPKDQLIERLTGRRVCKQCGAVYHVATNPPQNGACSKCGSTEIMQRNDDKPEAVKTRLQVYEEQTKPLKDFYKGQGKLVEIVGTGEVSQVFGRIRKELEA